MLALVSHRNLSVYLFLSKSRGNLHLTRLTSSHSSCNRRLTVVCLLRGMRQKEMDHDPATRPGCNQHPALNTEGRVSGDRKGMDGWCIGLTNGPTCRGKPNSAVRAVRVNEESVDDPCACRFSFGSSRHSRRTGENEIRSWTHQLRPADFITAQRRK